MKAVVFLGPSLPLANARQILDAVYLPPARQADLMSAVLTHRPDVIGLIDGVFLQSLSVWHKEILYALDQGVAVYGASSMGALRAAETAAFGMVGVGEIYRLYAGGHLTDDDEVALSHSSAEDGYRKLSEPMVNVRATVAAARTAGVVGADDADLLVAAAKGIYFAERTLSAVLAAAARAGVADDVLVRLSQFFVAKYVDQKRLDAVELLQTVRDLGAKPPPADFTFVRSSHFETLYNRDRHVRRSGIDVPLESIGYHVALNAVDFDDLNFHALNRAVVTVAADLLDIEAGKGEVEAEGRRFRTKRGLTSEEDFSAWLAGNDLEAAEFEDLMHELAVCRRLHRWLVIARWMDRTTKLVLDELRLEGRYEEWAERAAAQERLLGGDQLAASGEDASTPVDNLLAEQRAWVGVPSDVPADVWAEEAGFHAEGNLRRELLRTRRARDATIEMLLEAATAFDDADEGEASWP